MTVGTGRISDCYNQRLGSILRGYSDKSWREKQSIVAQIEREFGWKLYQKALKITGVREDAEDAVIHGLVALITRMASDQTVNRPWGLLSTVVKNYSINQAMGRNRRDMVETLHDGTADGNVKDDISGRLEARDLVAFALKQLSSEVDREIISLRAMYGFEFREIAETLLRKHGRSLSPRGVKARYDRACKKLRELLLEELTVNLWVGPTINIEFAVYFLLTEAIPRDANEQMTHLIDRMVVVERSHSTPIKAYSSLRVVRRTIALLRLCESRTLMITHIDHKPSCTGCNVKGVESEILRN